MPRYTIEVSKRVELVRYDYGTIEVDAESEREVKKDVARNFDNSDVSWSEGEAEEFEEESFEIQSVELSDDQPEEDEPDEDCEDEPEEVYDEEEGVFLTVGGKI